jgi:hypothetical protein
MTEKLKGSNGSGSQGFTKTAISKGAMMSFPLVGNLSEKPEGLRTSRNDRK